MEYVQIEIEGTGIAVHMSIFTDGKGNDNKKNFI